MSRERPQPEQEPAAKARKLDEADVGATSEPFDIDDVEDVILAATKSSLAVNVAASGVVQRRLPLIKIKVSDEEGRESEEDSLWFPVQPEAAKRVISRCHLAPMGKKDQTVVDTELRKTWELKESEVTIANKELWEAETLRAAIEASASKLGLDPALVTPSLHALSYTRLATSLRGIATRRSTRICWPRSWCAFRHRSKEARLRSGTATGAKPSISRQRLSELTVPGGGESAR